MERHEPTPPSRPAEKPAPPERVQTEEPTPPPAPRQEAAPRPEPMPHGPAARPDPTPPRPVARDIPMPPPVPTPTELLMDAPPAVPPFQQFSFLAAQPLSAADLEVITLFHATYMQAPGIGNDRAKFLQAKRDAAVVKPLMERQLTLARQGAEGENGGEARTVAVNLQWVNELLATQG